MVRISAVINTLNEERNLPGCLDSIRWVDEIVVVDMHSDDRTVEIARSHGARVLFFERKGYVNPARQFAFDAATGDWVLWIDADERCTPELAAALRQVAESNPAFDGLDVPMRNLLFGRWVEASGFGPPDYHMRFFRAGKLHFGEGIHTLPALDGTIARLNYAPELAIFHHAYPTIASFVERTNRYTTTEAKLLFDKGVETDWAAALEAGASEFVGRYFGQRGYADEMPGYLTSMLMGLYRFLTMAKLWELRRDAGLPTPPVPTDLGEIVAALSRGTSNATTSNGDTPTPRPRSAPPAAPSAPAASSVGWGRLGGGSTVKDPLLITGQQHIFIGDRVFIREGARIEAIEEYRGTRHTPRIAIGDGTSIEMFCHIGAANRVTIGRNVMIGGRVTIVDHDHGYRDPNVAPLYQPLVVGEVVIEDDVWIAEGAVILKNVHIGKHAVVGANAVVNQDVPAYAVVAGNPAKVVRQIEAPATPEPEIASDPPLVSLIVPIRDAADRFVPLCEAIAEHNSGLSYEVIFVDNGSIDGTPDLIAALDGDVGLIQNVEDRGPIAAINQAASVARGDLIVVLLDRTATTHGWIDHLLDSVDRGAAIVAPRVLAKDASLISAGGTIADDGTLSLRTTFPDSPAAIHFAPAPAFLLDRATLLAAGGLDEGYITLDAALAEFAVNVRAAGGRALYAPQSVVVSSRADGEAPEREADRQRFVDAMQDRFSGDAADPVVSIVIPVKNQVDFTRGCLEAIDATAGSVPFEVIVVDNGSTDETPDLLAGANVRVIRNETNVGFGPACNQGAQAATGGYVLFLNNDTLPQPGWIDALVATAEGDETIGAVGPKFLMANGSEIAEAGVHFFPHGHGFQRGRGADRDNPDFNVEADVDYCSAAGLLVRRAPFLAVGGFDDAYAPAYFEDADLCFALRDAGYRTVYQPASEIIHFEGTTSKKEYGSEAKRQKQEDVNRPTFLARWGEAVAARNDRPRRRPVAEGSPAGQRVLFIDYTLPIHDRAAGARQTFEFVSHLVREGAEVSFLAMTREANPKYRQELEAMSVRVHEHDTTRLHQLGLGFEPASLDFAQVLYDGQFDVAVISFWYVAAKYLPLIRHFSPNTRIVVDAHDVHYVREKRKAELAKDRKAMADAEENGKREMMVYRLTDAVITITEDDQRILAKRVPTVAAPIVPNVHEVVEDTPGRTGRRDLIYVGNFHHTPNVDAVLFAAGEILPLVRSRLPGIRLVVAGNAPPPEIQALAGPDVVVTGYVPDLNPLLDGALISIASLRYGSGMKGKIGEAMGRGLPVVTTSIGSEGMHLVDGEHCLVADTPATFADAVVRLATDATLWETLARNGKDHVRQHHGREAAGQALNRALFPMPSPVVAPVTTPAADAPVTTPADAPLVSIVLLTFNQLAYTLECLASIADFTHVPYEIVVVDNASTDGTPETLADLPVRLIRNSTNRGFAAGVNQGIVAARGEYIVLMNNDTVVTEDWIGRLLAPFAEPTIGVVGPRSNAVSGPQQIETSYGSDLDAMAAFAASLTRESAGKVTILPRLAGLCLAIRREVIDAIGGFDERFGIGNFEDDDYGIRAQVAGFRLAMAEDCFIHHYGSRTFIGSGVDYGAIMEKNWRVFKAKYGLPRRRPLSDGYPAALASQPFSKSKHFVALPATPKRLSVALIVKNEEQFLDRCLASVRGLADEIVVVDTGSTDGTVAIAERHGAKITHFSWVNDFSAARNAALDACTGDWVLVLDADEWLDPKSQNEVRRLIEQNRPAIQIVWIRSYKEDGTAENANTSPVGRLFPHRPDLRWEGAIHEQLMPTGSTTFPRLQSNILVHHDGYKASVIADRDKFARNEALLHQAIANETTLTAYKLFQLGATYLGMGRIDAAADQFAKAIHEGGKATEASPGYLLQAHIALATSLNQLGRAAEALPYAETIRRLLPTLPDAWFVLAQSHALLGDADAAIAEYRRAIACKSNANQPSVESDRSTGGWKAWKEIGEVELKRRDNPAAAADAYRRAIVDRPDDADLRLNLVTALERSGNLTEAELETRALLALADYADHPASVQAIGRLADIRQRLDDVAGAADILEQGTRRWPESGYLLLKLGRLADDSGLVDEAADCYLRYLDAHAEDGAVWATLGRLLLRADRAADARLALEQARQNGEAVLLDLGVACLTSGDATAALEVYRAAASAEPANPAAQFGIAMASFLARDLEGARLALDTTERLQPDYPDLVALRQAIHNSTKG